MSEKINSNEPVQAEAPADEPADVQTPKEKTYSEAEYNALKSQLDALEQAAKDNEDFKKKFEETGAVGKIAGFIVYEWADSTANLLFIAGHPKFATRVKEWSAPVKVEDLKDGKVVDCQHCC